jgi:hypothetical protein
MKGFLKYLLLFIVACVFSICIYHQIVPEENKVLIHKETKEISFGHWICNGDSADNWEEIDKSEIIEEENETAK